MVLLQYVHTYISVYDVYLYNTTGCRGLPYLREQTVTYTSRFAGQQQHKTFIVYINVIIMECNSLSRLTMYIQFENTKLCFNLVHSATREAKINVFFFNTCWVRGLSFNFNANISVFYIVYTVHCDKIMTNETN